MEISIDKNVPLPPGIITEKNQLGALPLDDMKKGDSFFVPKDRIDEHERRLSALRMRILRYNKRNPGTRFAVVRDGETGYRVFRTH